MGFLKTLTRAITRLNDLIGRWTAHLVLVMFALLFAEVLLRYLLHAPTVWTGELSQMLFGAYALLGGGYLLAHGGHVNVDLLHNTLPRRKRAALDVGTSVLFFAFVGVLVWQGSSLAYESVASWERSHSAWNPPIWPIKLVIPVAAMLVLLQGVAKLIDDLQVALRRDPGDTDETSDKTGNEPGDML